MESTQLQQSSIPVLGATVPVQVAGNATHPSFAGFSADDQISFIRSYDPKAATVEGFRHAVIRFRETGPKGNNGAVSKPAKMATIPVIILDEDSYLLPDEAKQVLIGILEDQQDVMIRSAIENNESKVSWDSLSIYNCLIALTAVRVSQRLTKEGIEAWFNVSPLMKACTDRGQQIATAKTYDADNTKKQIAGTINAYREKFSKLAAAVPNLGQETAQSILNMLTVSGASDDMAKILAKKLNTILNPPAANDGDL